MATYQHRWLSTADGLRLYARDYPSDGSAPVVLCLHGLTRNAADFEALADVLAPRYRVLAMDQRGRGRSDYDANPQNYQLGTYVNDTLAVLDALAIEQATLIGTSMGGLMAMLMAGMQPHRFRGLVLNDIGPVVEAAGLARIRGYVGKSAAVASWEDAVQVARDNNALAFPDLTDEEWSAFARRLFREDAAGHLEPAYDTAIASPIHADTEAAVPADLWPLFETLRAIPMLVIRGALSDILSAATVGEMAHRHPALQTVEVPRRGHAPLLSEPQALEAIERFLGGL